MTKCGGGNQINPHKEIQCKTQQATTHPQGQPAPLSLESTFCFTFLNLKKKRKERKRRKKPLQHSLPIASLKGILSLEKTRTKEGHSPLLDNSLMAACGS